MIKKSVLRLGLLLAIFFASTKPLAANQCGCEAPLKIVFIEPEVSDKMDRLNWKLPALNEWRHRPERKVNKDLDGEFLLTVKVLNVPDELIKTTPRLKICPISQASEKCWEQEVLGPIDRGGIFKSRVYFGLSNWSKHLLKFKIGKEIVKVIIDEDSSL